MPSKQDRSLASRRRRWDLVLANRKKITASLPHLEGDLGDLAAAAKEIVALAAKQAYYAGKTREVTGKLRLLSKQADRLRGRIGASLRGQHGFDSSELIQYGFTPRRPTSPQEIPVDHPDPLDDFPGEATEE
ncbi:MAG TPA: hypothetical protein VF173_23605 [Thermoanaerobaculia bacterium]|nr:hypothetical protein [Thermoanaerobaculia bacterium]